MFVYVVSKEGKPLMPTKRFGWVRRALKQGKAKVIRRTPFTIQLTYDSSSYIQDITLGVDAGSKHIGVSASTSTKELFSAEVEQRSDVKKNIDFKREMRRSRRNRKLRYRKPRFLNRKREKGWIPPSSRQKVQTHLSVVNLILTLLPITKIIVEAGQFDPHKLKNPEVSGAGYQQGELYSYEENVKAYIRDRDSYTCKVCGSKDDLEVHHILFKSQGGTDTPVNLATLCHICHHKLHQGLLSKKEMAKITSAAKQLRDAAWMNLVRPYVIPAIKQAHPDIEVEETFGCETALKRRELNLSKSHVHDGFCIANNLKATLADATYLLKKIRRHNRQIHKANPLKGGIRKRNQCPHEVFGFHRFDKVKIKGQTAFITGLRLRGYFMFKSIKGQKVAECSYKQAQHLENPKGFLVEVSTF